MKENVELCNNVEHEFHFILGVENIMKLGENILKNIFGKDQTYLNSLS